MKAHETKRWKVVVGFPKKQIWAAGLALLIAVSVVGRVRPSESYEPLPQVYQESPTSVRVRESLLEAFPGGRSEVARNGEFKTILQEGLRLSPTTAARAVTARVYDVSPEFAPNLQLSQAMQLEGARIYRYQMSLGRLRVFPDRLTLGFGRDERLQMVTGELHPFHLESLPEGPTAFSSSLLTTAGFEEFETMKEAEPVLYSPRAMRAWLLYVERLRTFEAYELVLATDAEVLMERPLTADLQRNQGPQGLVFRDGSPQPNWSLGAPPPPLADREMVPLDGTIDMGRQPLVLEGSTVRTFDDRRGDARPIRSDLANGCDFCAPLQLVGALPPDPAASGVNAHYWAALAHDRLKALGFLATVGNFEGDDPMLLMEQSINPRMRNNSLFVGAPDGISGKIILFPWDGKPDRSSALDATLVLHEYGHGLTNRLTGFWGLLGEAADEAVADTVAFVVRGFPPTSTVAIGAYVAQNPKGVRLYPYSTDPSIDRVTFADFPLLGVAGAKPEKHYMGEILASTLWSIRASLMQRYGQEQGATRFGRLLLGTLMLVNTFPTFPEFRDAFLNADKLLYDRADLDLIWQVATKKKLGWLAYTNAQTFQNPFWSMISDDQPNSGTVMKAKVGLSGGKPQLFWFVLGDPGNSTTVATLGLQSSKTKDAIGVVARRDGAVFVSPPIFVVPDAPATYPKLRTAPQDTVIITYQHKAFQVPIG